MKRLRLAAGLALFLAAGAAVVACSATRETLMDWNNAELVGETAPALEGGTWVATEPWLAREPDVERTLLVVFRPG